MKTLINTNAISIEPLSFLINGGGGQGRALVNKALVYELEGISITKSSTSYQAASSTTEMCPGYYGVTGNSKSGSSYVYYYKCDTCGQTTANYGNGKAQESFNRSHSRTVTISAKAATRTYKLKYKENEISITISESSMNTGDFPEYNGTNNSLFGDGDIADINIKDDVVTIKRLRNDKVIHTYTIGE